MRPKSYSSAHSLAVTMAGGLWPGPCPRAEASIKEPPAAAHRGPTWEDLLPPRSCHDWAGGQQPGSPRHRLRRAPVALWDALYQSHGQHPRTNTVPAGHLSLLTQENFIFKGTQEMSTTGRRGPRPHRGSCSSLEQFSGVSCRALGVSRLLCACSGLTLSFHTVFPAHIRHHGERGKSQEGLGREGGNWK